MTQVQSTETNHKLKEEILSRCFHSIGVTELGANCLAWELKVEANIAVDLMTTYNNKLIGRNLVALADAKPTTSPCRSGHHNIDNSKITYQEHWEIGNGSSENHLSDRWNTLIALNLFSMTGNQNPVVQGRIIKDAQGFLKITKEGLVAIKAAQEFALDELCYFYLRDFPR